MENGDVEDLKQTSGIMRCSLPAKWIHTFHSGLIPTRPHRLQATNGSPAEAPTGEIYFLQLMLSGQAAGDTGLIITWFYPGPATLLKSGSHPDHPTQPATPRTPSHNATPGPITGM